MPYLQPARLGISAHERVVLSRWTPQSRDPQPPTFLTHVSGGFFVRVVGATARWTPTAASWHALSGYRQEVGRQQHQ